MVIDTMLYVYALLGVTEFRDASLLAFARTGRVYAPTSLRIEMLNALWKWVEVKKMPQHDASAAYSDMEAIVAERTSTEQLWDNAWKLAIERHHSPYDTVFVALAISRGCKVVTCDRQFMERFPEYTVSLHDYVSTT